MLGDSLTLGRDISKSLPQRLAEKYPLMDVVNLGIGGNYTSQMLARVSDVDKYKPFRVWVWGGNVDVPNSISAATIQSNLQSIYTYFSAQGIEVWAMTIIPRDDNTAPMIVVRDTVNDWIKNTATGLSGYVDAFTLIADPENTDIRLAEYALGINHINDTGHAVIAEHIS